MFLGFNSMYYIVPFLMNLRNCGWDILKSGVAFFYHMPLYMVFFQIYAFCKIDDLTWGTKARENLALGVKITNNRIINAKFVGKWLLINFFVGFCKRSVSSDFHTGVGVHVHFSSCLQIRRIFGF